MHVLLTNDDGPLNDSLCPYIKYLVDEITTHTNWKLTIVVPNAQRSWIGKAHFAGKTLTTTYIYTQPSTETDNKDINTFIGPFTTPQKDLVKTHQQWNLLDSTPAACADIGIHHICEEPVDLVISGPNFGKNSSNLYILSSGTVGAAMEACTHGVKSIALSYEFRSLDHSYTNLKEAAKISVKLIAKLYHQWTANVDLYLINIPLIDSLKLGATKIEYAPVQDNKWDSIYQQIGESQFQWNPDFKKVYKDGLTDYTHSDLRVLHNDRISVTPMKAAFYHQEPLRGEITLDDELSLNELTLGGDTKKVFLITVDASNYIYKPLVESFSKLGYTISHDKAVLSQIPSVKVFHYGEYEDLDIDLLQSNPDSYFIPSYIYRKALIRKHFLANTIHHFVAKNPTSVLSKATPESYQLEVDYAEFLDDALDEAYELRSEIEAGQKTWILKPSMSDKGQGIRVFNTVEQLQEIFDSFEEEEEDEGENGVIVSQLRHFIVQEYESRPLLLSAYNNKKFHFRTYVVSQGDIAVYVYKNILTLFADSTYKYPEGDQIDMDGHLTNTCLQGQDALVVPFWKLEGVSDEDKKVIYKQIKSITGDLFRAATSVDKINFQPLANAVEVFGVDFLVNENLEVKLLEVNSYPDFKQTGEELKGLIYELFNEVSLVADSLVATQRRTKLDIVFKE